jgi:hypothetical protein
MCARHSGGSASARRAAGRQRERERSLRAANSRTRRRAWELLSSSPAQSRECSYQLASAPEPAGCVRGKWSHGRAGGRALCKHRGDPAPRAASAELQAPRTPCCRRDKGSDFAVLTFRVIEQDSSVGCQAGRRFLGLCICHPLLRRHSSSQPSATPPPLLLPAVAAVFERVHAGFCAAFRGFCDEDRAQMPHCTPWAAKEQGQCHAFDGRTT